MGPRLSARAAVFALLLGLCAAAGAQDCAVRDPELQGSYSGPCLNGLAEGAGYARGTAEYRGSFHAGRKHGEGVKSWPNGERYEGEFFEDYKHGTGRYVFGRGPWDGEMYQGAFVKDRRHGTGAYLWASGDVYSGPWENDVATGPAAKSSAARSTSGTPSSKGGGSTKPSGGSGMYARDSGVPELDPTRKINEQDCTKPVVLDGGNLLCK